ncbi:MAG TPA: hypothetical protein PLN63_10150, partial [Paludibacteraceae bacterium]|nr:hypothetical protein [Paludibacteraceae bacterium]
RGAVNQHSTTKLFSNEKDSISVHYSSEDIKGGDGHWNLGTATKGIVVKLKKDENKDTNK